ncbi:DUF904 domain-containing protein [Herbaspirillum lusitanum]|uniref:DUF904 domain-containing protein n=1 Tax=Herbaspirillum lusitanum TaxID=213312 RepID=A0ABW9A4M0_9BURK
MSNEFQQLSEKVSQLALLAQSLRSENASLRRNVVSLTDQNADLQRRIDAAHERVSAVLEKLPVAPPLETTEEETA